MGALSLRRTVVGALLAATALSGCASKSLYEWGTYEDSIHAMYLDPGAVAVGDQIQQLEAQIERTHASGLYVPPGLHTHLAYLYVAQGDHATALVHLQSEKALFPESSRFVDGIIERMQQ